MSTPFAGLWVPMFGGSLTIATPYMKTAWAHLVITRPRASQCGYGACSLLGVFNIHILDEGEVMDRAVYVELIED